MKEDLRAMKLVLKERNRKGNVGITLRDACLDLVPSDPETNDSFWSQRPFHD